MSAYPLDDELLPMNESDLDAVAGLESIVQAFPWTRGHFADSLRSGYRARVWRRGGELLGFYVVMSVIDEAHLLNIAVAPAHQGLGHGARLLRRLMDEARADGASTLFLEVRPSNARAVDLYRHFGFRQIGRRKNYYPAADGREDGLIFDRSLA